MTDSEHAILSASGSTTWGYCSGSLTASKGFPDVETDEQRAGTAGHWVVSSQLDLFRQTGVVPDLAHLVGTKAPNGVEIDEEMIAAAQIMIDDVIKVVGTNHFLIEQRVYMPQIHNECWGTFDCAYFCVVTGKLYLWDFKYGRRSVEAFEHFQMVLYVIGLMNLFNISQNVEVVISIVAPRTYHIDGPINRWQTMLYDLAPYMRTLQAKALEALGPNPTLTVGKHCRDCPAVGICSAARKASYNVLSFVDETFQLDDMSDEDLGLEYEIMETALKIVEARRDALADMISYKIHVERSVRTGYAIGRGKGKWVWTAPDFAIKAIGDSFGIDVEKKSLITPAQLRDKLKKDDKTAFLDNMLDKLARLQRGKEKLIPHANSLSAKVFGRGK